MNHGLLLKHFEQISEAPDAVPRLRRFILDLAVRGKLVPQDPNDEPALELLKRISSEKRQIVKEGRMRTARKGVLDNQQIPFLIPDTWEWTQLEQIGIINPRNYIDGNPDASFVPMSMIFAEYGKRSKHEVRPWVEIKNGFTHFAEGDVGLAKITPCFENGKSTVFRTLTNGIGAGTTELHIVRPIFVDPDYILVFLKSSHYIGAGILKMTGTAGQKRVPRDYFAFTPFPLPPLEEQHRIVAKVDDLMAVCDELEATQEKRERRRDRLVASTLHSLNNGASGDEFRQNAGFFLNHLSNLTTRPEHVQQLRQTILNLAVRGKLVPQDPNDESVESLISFIKCERKRRCKEAGTIDAYASTASRDGDFPIPKSWRWVKLGFVANVVMGQSPPGETYNTRGEGLPLINGPVEFSEGPFGKTVLNQFTTSPSKLCNKGDLLLCVRGSTTGRTNVAGFDACIGRGVAALHPLYADQFLRLFIWSWRDKIIEMGRGIAFPSISRGQIENLPVPFPPLAEQKRIVAKVDELMNLCDRLEAQIDSTGVTRRRFLEATLEDL